MGLLYGDELELASSSDNDCDYRVSGDIRNIQRGVVTDHPYTRKEETTAQKSKCSHAITGEQKLEARPSCLSPGSRSFHSCSLLTKNYN